MKSGCESCKTWKEQMYWSSVQMIQFFQILSGVFDQELVIPQKIAKKLRNKLDTGYVSLTGPSGIAWRVELTAIGDLLFLRHGWKEFVDAHSLEENDLLVFKYKGASKFDVSMFDGQSSCEKEVSFVLSKCQHVDFGSESRTKRPNDVSEAPARKKSKASTPISSSSKSSSDEYEATLSQTSESSSYGNYVVAEGKKRKFSSATTSSARGPRRANTNLRSRKIKSTRTGGDTSYQRRALDLANAVTTPNSCVVIMKRSHVKGGYYMSVPSEWARTHLPHRDLDVTLQYNKRKWKAEFTVTDHGGALSGGWKDFVNDNFLNISDVCVFNLARGENEDTILDVNIFRHV